MTPNATETTVTYIVQYYDTVHGVDGHVKTRHCRTESEASHVIDMLPQGAYKNLKLIKQTTVTTKEYLIG